MVITKEEVVVIILMDIINRNGAKVNTYSYRTEFEPEYYCLDSRNCEAKILYNNKQYCNLEKYKE